MPGGSSSDNKRETPVTNENLLQFMKDCQKKNEQWYNEVKDLKKEHLQLVSKVSAVEASHIKLSNKVDRHQAVLSRLEQGPLNANLLIRGINENKSEKLPNIAGACFKAVDSKIKFSILSARRVGKKQDNQNRAILVQLSSTTAKTQLMNAKRKKPLAASNVVVEGKCLGGPDDLIYFGEQLGSLNSRIYFVARQLVKKGQLHSTWTRNGVVSVRKCEGDDPQDILDEDAFKDLFTSDVLDEDCGDEVGVNQSLRILDECLNSTISPGRNRNLRSKTKPTSN